MIVELECLPTPPGTSDNRYAHVEAAIDVIKASGLAYEVGPLGTSFEGSADDVWRVLRQAHEACLAHGAESLVSVVKIAETATGTVGMSDLTGPHR